MPHFFLLLYSPKSRQVNCSVVLCHNDMSRLDTVGRKDAQFFGELALNLNIKSLCA